MKEENEHKFIIAGIGCEMICIIAFILFLLILFLVKGGWMWLCFIVGIVVLYLIISAFSN